MSALPLLALLTAFAPAAQAAEVAVLGLHLSSLDEAQADEAASRMAAALRGIPGLDPVEPDELRRRLAGRERLVLEAAFLGAGRKALEEGRILYERGELEDAATALQGAVGLLREGMPVATDNRLLIDALLMLGLTRFSNGEEAAAAEAFQEVARLDPSRRLDAVKYSGPTVAFFDQARAKVEAAGTGTLEVTGPPGHGVFVDGRSRGETPLRVDGLPSGTHTVLVQGPAGRRAFSQVEIKAGAGSKLSPNLRRSLLASGGTSVEERRRQTRQLYEALGTYGETELLLLAGEAAPGELVLQLYEPRTGNFSTIEPAGSSLDSLQASLSTLPSLLTEGGALRTEKVFARVAPLDIEANALLLRLLLDPAPLSAASAAGGTDGASTAPDEDRRRGGLPWYVWAGVGTVAAGGAATAVVLSTGGGGAGGGTITVGPLP